MQLDGTNRGPIVFEALSVKVNEFLLEMCILLHLIIGLFVHSKSESVKHFSNWSCYNLANALACRDSRSFFRTSISYNIFSLNGGITLQIWEIRNSQTAYATLRG